MHDRRDSPVPIRFSHDLNARQVTIRSLGVIIAAIVFALLGNVASTAGPLVPLTILLAALLVLVNGLGYAELATSAPRSSGTYALVRDKQGNTSLTFLTGWALALSGLALCGLLAQGAAHYLNTFLTSLFNLAAPAGLLGMALVALVVLTSSLGGLTRRYLPFTLPMVILLIILVVLAAPRLPATDHEAGIAHPGPAIASLMAAFVGLEIIATHQGGIRRRAVNLPRAWLGTPVLVSILGALIAAVAIGVAGPQEAATVEAPLALAAGDVGGAAGWVVVLILGSVVPVFAMGRMLTIVFRLLYAMNLDGFWPAWLREFNTRQGAPLRLILLGGLLILPTVWISTDLLSKVGGLLYLLVLMAVNLTLARQSRPSREPGQAGDEAKERPITSLPPARDRRQSFFALPFHPWVPALTLAIDVLVIPLWGTSAIIWTAVCLAVGGLIYLAYGRSHHIEAKEGVTVFRSHDDEYRPSDFRILVPVADPKTAKTLLRVAGQLAQSQGGQVLALHVVVVPELLPLESGRQRAQAGQAILDQVLPLANGENLPFEPMTRVARSVAQGILDTAVEEKVTLIILDWRGVKHRRSTSLGPLVEAILQNAPCDVVMMQGKEARPPKKILVPTSGGPHARAAIRLAVLLADAYGADVTLLHVQSRPDSADRAEGAQRQMAEALKGLSYKHHPEQKVVQAANVVDGIVKEARSHNMVLLGVSEETLLDRLVFGNIPLQVAARVPTTALVQGYRGITGIWLRRLLHTLRVALPTLDTEEQSKLREELERGAQPDVNYFVLIILSCIIAALGLLLNSPAVVIGAMLVAPLMTPILAFPLGLVMGDLRLIRFSTEAIIKGIALALVIAAFIGLLSPLKMVTGEMHARTQPTLLDLAVALASGMAGAYALARKDVSAALPGVAIAAALMPPLATVGLGLSLGNARVAGGAFLLFAANIAAISLAGGMVFLLLGVRPQRWGTESRRRLRQSLAASLILLFVIAIPMGIIMNRTVQDAARERAIEAILTERLADTNSQLVTLEIVGRRDGLSVIATVRSTETFSPETVGQLARTLSEQLNQPVQLEMTVLPVIRVREEPQP